MQGWALRECCFVQFSFSNLLVVTSIIFGFVQAANVDNSYMNKNWAWSFFWAVFCDLVMFELLGVLYALIVLYAIDQQKGRCKNWGLLAVHQAIKDSLK